MFLESPVTEIYSLVNESDTALVGLWLADGWPACVCHLSRGGGYGGVLKGVWCASRVKERVVRQSTSHGDSVKMCMSKSQDDVSR